jgi:hypothetical protein
MGFDNLMMGDPYFNPQKVVRWKKTSNFFPNDLQYTAKCDASRR